MLVVGSADVHRICAWPASGGGPARSPIRVRAPLIARASIEAEVRGVTQTYFNLPAFLPGVAMGTKIATILPDNPARHPGVPAVQALYALFDGDDGSPAAVMDGTALTYRKTAADSALGSLLLSRADARVLLMVGAGGLAPYLARAHLAIRPSLARVLVWNRTPARAEELAAALRDEGVDAAAASTSKRPCAQADILSCSTAATEPLVAGAWLKPGAHLDLVGGFTPAMRECDDDGRASRAAVHRRGQHQSRACGDLIDPIRRGVIARAKVEGDLYDLCRPGLVTRPCAGGHHPVQERRRRASRPVHGPVHPRPAARGGGPWLRRSRRLFEPLTIRHRTLRNRIVFGAHTANMAEDGLPGPRHLGYYRERALGGAAMIVVEPVPVHATAVLTRGNFRHSSDEVIPHFRRITEAVKAEGAVILHQLYHVGQHGDFDNSFMPGWSPSGLPSFHDSDGSHRMSEAEIEEVIDGLRPGGAARQGVRLRRGRAVRGLSCADRPVLDALLQPPRRPLGRQPGEPGAVRQPRSCAASGPWPARTSSSGSRSTCTPRSRPRSRSSSCRRSWPGTTSEQLADYVTCGTGSYFDFTGLIPTVFFADKLGAPYAEALKAVTRHMKVQAESHIRTPENAEYVVASGQADMVSIVRGQIADPHLANKAQAGRAEDIRPCLSCNQMCWGRRFRDYWISCLINPSAGREWEWGGDRFSRAEAAQAGAGGGRRAGRAGGRAGRGRTRASGDAGRGVRQAGRPVPACRDAAAPPADPGLSRLAGAPADPDAGRRPAQHAHGRRRGARVRRRRGDPGHGLAADRRGLSSAPCRISTGCRASSGAMSARPRR